jgi:hypothetical protein
MIEMEVKYGFLDKQGIMQEGTGTVNFGYNPDKTVSDGKLASVGNPAVIYSAELVRLDEHDCDRKLKALIDFRSETRSGVKGKGEKFVWRRGDSLLKIEETGYGASKKEQIVDGKTPLGRDNLWRLREFVEKMFARRCPVEAYHWLKVRYLNKSGEDTSRTFSIRPGPKDPGVCLNGFQFTEQAKKILGWETGDDHPDHAQHSVRDHDVLWKNGMDGLRDRFRLPKEAQAAVEKLMATVSVEVTKARGERVKADRKIGYLTLPATGVSVRDGVLGAMYVLSLADLGTLRSFFRKALPDYGVYQHGGSEGHTDFAEKMIAAAGAECGFVVVHSDKVTYPKHGEAVLENPRLVDGFMRVLFDDTLPDTQKIFIKIYSGLDKTMLWRLLVVNNVWKTDDLAHFFDRGVTAFVNEEVGVMLTDQHFSMVSAYMGGAEGSYGRHGNQHTFLEMFLNNPTFLDDLVTIDGMLAEDPVLPDGTPMGEAGKLWLARILGKGRREDVDTGRVPAKVAASSMLNAMGSDIAALDEAKRKRLRKACKLGGYTLKSAFDALEAGGLPNLNACLLGEAIERRSRLGHHG